MTQNATNPTAINMTFANYRFSVNINPSINQLKQLIIGGTITFQRCNVDNNGLYTDDPSQGSSQTLAIGDLNVFAAENPTLAADIAIAWSALSTFAEALNQQNKLV